MVKYLESIVMIILLFPAVLQAAPSLKLELQKTTVEYGRPLYIKIIGEGLKYDLSSLQLTALSEQFSIATQDLETEILPNNADKTVLRRQILRLKLYPRRTGEIRLPAFTLGKSHSSEQIIRVKEANNKGSSILLSRHSSSTETWQREQILVTVSLSTAEEFATIRFSDTRVEGLEITALPVKRVWSENEGGQSLITAGLSILPLRAGNSNIALPAIEYHLNGVVRRVFHLPRLKLKTQPLPSYLPPTIPVAKVNIKSSVIAADSAFVGGLYTGELAYWNISLESPSLSPYWLPSILRQIKSTDDVHFFPASSQRSTQPDNTGVHGRVSHRIPFKPLNNGSVNLPDLKIQYFDPQTGRLESLVVSTKKPFALSMISRLLLALVLSVALLVLLRMFYRSMREKLHYRKKYQQAVLQIRHAQTSRQVLDGLRMVAEAEGWPVNLSLSGWLSCWKKKYQSDPVLERKLESLAQLHYGKRKDKNKPPAELAVITELAELIVPKTL